MTATELADKHQVSIRTIYRDIRTLQQSGVPIVTEEGRGYTMMEGFRLPPVMFTTEEAHALVTAEQLIRKNKDRSLTDHYESGRHQDQGRSAQQPAIRNGIPLRTSADPR